MKKSILAGFFALIIVSCGKNSTETNVNNSNLPSTGKVPVGQLIAENYSPTQANTEEVSKRIGKLSSQSLEELGKPDAITLAEPSPAISIKYPEKPPKEIKGQQVELGGIPAHGYTGLTLINGKGIWEGHSAWTTVKLPSPKTLTGNRIYAPTTLPKGLSCLEVLSAYWNDTKNTATVGQIWVWNHCNSSNPHIYKRGLDEPDFTNDHVRNSPSGVPRYYAGVYESADNVWTFMLWNFTKSIWEYPVTVAGTNPLPQTQTGWTMWESYIENKPTPCPIYNQTFYAWTPNLLVGSNWKGLTDSDTMRLVNYDDCAENGSYFHRIYTPGTSQIEHWEVSNYQ